MAKKKRTPNLSAAQLYRPGRTKKDQVLQSAVETDVESEENLAAEYSYVLKDLKHIMILALVMLVLLIVLSLILV